MSNQPKRVQIEMPANLRAQYANLAIISHTTNEIFIDFAQLLPGIPKTQVHTRMVMTPTHAKLLLRALAENLERYEAKQGSIDVPPSLADQLFGSVRPGDNSEESDPDEG